MLDLIDLEFSLRKFHPKAAEYTFFSGAHGSFRQIDHSLGYKTTLSKHKKIKTISSFFYNRNSMKLEISYMKKIRKDTNIWRLNNILQNN